ncbi:MAG: peptide chain release factor N(5)-glutamine methyltransferase [Aquisalinus sp.]|nr:peptide chain release factor N(5)-glutamine methyltransferase [Aquisalinus sp.]
MTVSAGVGAATALRSTTSSYPSLLRLDVRILLLHCLSVSLERFIAEPDMKFNEMQAEQFNDLIVRRLKGEPVSQLIGHKEFWGLDFKVSDAVLTPRPDSEALIELALEIFSDKPPSRVIDLGTGSGCLLAAVLSEFPHATGVAVDIDESALEIARQNFESLGIAERISTHCADFAHYNSDSFDLIISNPPYIAEADRSKLPVDVKDFEPARALFAGDGYDAYRKLAMNVPSLLNPGGAVVLEVGQGQSGCVLSMFQQAFRGEGLETSTYVKPDLAGIDRAIALKRC